jgi:hypothetical protein
MGQVEGPFPFAVSLAKDDFLPAVILKFHEMVDSVLCRRPMDNLNGWSKTAKMAGTTLEAVSGRRMPKRQSFQWSFIRVWRSVQGRIRKLLYHCFPERLREVAAQFPFPWAERGGGARGG